MELVTRWLWIILAVVVVLLLVHPRSKATTVIGALSEQTKQNVMALQGNG